MAGRLVLVGTPLGNLGDLSPRAAQALRDADVIACEDTRHTRKLLSAAGIAGERLVSVHQHNEQEAGEALVGRIVRDGLTVALVSDAGMPAISDPGERVVRAALDAGVAVEVVPGPTAVTTALALSGLPTARFCFEGFLPRKGRERAARLEVLAGEQRTTVLYEAPHRLAETLDDLVRVCGPDRRVVLARELTKYFEETWRGSLAEASEHARTVDPRGEFTVVLEGAAPPPAATTEDVAAAVARHLEAGATRKDAAAAVAAELGVSRRIAYEAANELGRGRGGRP